jgi:protein O-mannosyl-transferase
LNVSLNTDTRRKRWPEGACAIVIMLIIALVYWPVSRAQFVWDDIVDFQRMAWLRHGDDWQHMLLHKFNDWAAYFRPLGVALFTLEVRAFDTTPGPMHLISLLIHLVNTLLVGVLATQLSVRILSQNVRLRTLALPMLLYGLHPVLVEPTVWIGCQFDLVATLFMLLGWLAGIRIKHSIIRAIAVSTCFFLAACAKESAIAFLPILLVLNWIAMEVSQDQSVFAQLRKLLTRYAATYFGVLLAGSGYLALRHLALGDLIPNVGGQILPFGARLQESSFLYLHYWRMFFWPTVHMGPIHQVDVDRFIKISVWSLLQDALALCILATGIVLTIRRRYTGALIFCVTLALFPVLHVIAANFDSSLYHERYALTALAVACAWLPLALSEIPTYPRMQRILSLLAYIGLATWIALAIMNIRVTIPLWSTQVNLWQWALQENPGSVSAKDELISGYIDAGDHTDAWRLIDGLMASHTPCINCMLNAATLALREHDTKRADFFLQQMKNSPDLYGSPTTLRVYLTDIGALELMEGHADVAERVERLAANQERLDPNPQLFLAQALATQGKTDEATQVENTAITLMEPSQREQQQQWFARFLQQVHDHPQKKPNMPSER